MNYFLVYTNIPNWRDLLSPVTWPRASAKSKTSPTGGAIPRSSEGYRAEGNPNSSTPTGRVLAWCRPWKRDSHTQGKGSRQPRPTRRALEDDHVWRSARKNPASAPNPHKTGIRGWSPAYLVGVPRIRPRK
jgi:hypothetical protein